LHKKIKKNIFIGIGLAVIVYFVFISINDFSLISSSFSNFPISNFIVAQLLAILALYLKYVRWAYYIKILELKLSVKDSFLVFASGLLMSISPGKVGELLKSFLIKDKYDIPISVSSSAVISERIIEFISLIVLGIFGLALFNFGSEYLVVFMVISFGIMFIVFNTKFQNYAYKTIIKLSKSNKIIDDVKLFRSSFNKLFYKTHVYRMFLLSILTWIIECFAFYIIITGLYDNMAIIWSVFSYTFAIFIGAISMLPGGLGTTEGALLYMLIQNEIIQSDAIIIILFIRIITLWLPVIIGFISLILYLRDSKA
jgi:uncharacterized protein (TIRG00374 family)